MSTTKKMLSSIGPDGQPGRGSEFVIPHPFQSSGDGFYGLKTGKSHSRAAMTFIGRSISAADVIEKLQKPVKPSEQMQQRIEEFLSRLQDFKIGNVVSISYDADGGFTLRLEAISPPRQSLKSLP